MSEQSCRAINFVFYVKVQRVSQPDPVRRRPPITCRFCFAGCALALSYKFWDAAPDIDHRNNAPSVGRCYLRNTLGFKLTADLNIRWTCARWWDGVWMRMSWVGYLMPNPMRLSVIIVRLNAEVRTLSKIRISWRSASPSIYDRSFWNLVYTVLILWLIYWQLLVSFGWISDWQ